MPYYDSVMVQTNDFNSTLNKRQIRFRNVDKYGCQKACSITLSIEVKFHNEDGRQDMKLEESNYDRELRSVKSWVLLGTD